MSILQIIIPIRAYPQGSKRHVGNGRMIEQAGQNLKTYRHAVATLARIKHPTPLDGALNVSVVFEFTRPKKHYIRGILRNNAPPYPYPAKRGDIDKLLRSTLDALTGVWFHDDAQVVRVCGLIRWAQHDATIIKIKTV